MKLRPVRLHLPSAICHLPFAICCAYGQIHCFVWQGSQAGPGGNWKDVGQQCRGSLRQPSSPTSHQPCPPKPCNPLRSWHRSKLPLSNHSSPLSNHAPTTLQPHAILHHSSQCPAVVSGPKHRRLRTNLMCLDSKCQPLDANNQVLDKSIPSFAFACACSFHLPLVLLCTPPTCLCRAEFPRVWSLQLVLESSPRSSRR